MKKICIFTAVDCTGGISQFANQIASELKNLNCNVEIYVSTTNRHRFSDGIKTNYFLKKKSIFCSDNAKNLAVEINSKLFDAVIFAENSIFSQQVLTQLKGSVKKFIVIHDVIPHSSFFDLRKKMVEVFVRILQWRTLAKTDFILLLSDNSYNQFKSVYKEKYLNKTSVIPLGAHVPHVNNVTKPKELSELNNDESFILFFGRIDKYKDIPTLISAYRNSNKKMKLLIAGKRQDHVEMEINDSDIYYLNRFISDEEMVWLFEKASYVVLPYLNASQSGVLPISYFYGVPVIASNIPGLAELVHDRETGFLYNNKENLTKILNFTMEICSDEYYQLKHNIKIYFDNYFNWKHNLMGLIEKIEN